MQVPVMVTLVFSIVGVSATLAADGSASAARYGVGIVGNCATHGTQLFVRFNGHPRTKVIAGYAKDPRRARELAESFGVKMLGSCDEVIEHPDVQIVGIACDPCDKPAMVEKAAAAGKHIFLNKPLAADLAGGRRIREAVRKYGVQFIFDIPMVRYRPVYARLLREVRAGKYGEVLGYHHLFGMNFDPDFPLAEKWPERLDPPEVSGGGEMTNMGCYAIDFAVSLFGMPKWVTAKWRKTWDVYRKADVENFGQIVLDYGAFYAFLEVGKQQLPPPHGHSNSMTINFEHATMLIDLTAKVATVNHVLQDWETFTEGAENVNPVDQLLDAIEKGIPPASGVDNAVEGVEVLMAAYRSIVLGGKAVALPLDSEANPLVRARGRASPARTR